MKKLLLTLITILASITSYMQADFVAYRRMEHRDGRVIHLLYDIHQSLVHNKDAIEQSEKNIGDAYRSNYEGIQVKMDPLIEQFKNNHLPNLMRQQRDLAEIIKKRQASAIVEDSYNVQRKRERFDHRVSSYLHCTLGNYVQCQTTGRIDPRLRANVSPMWGLGELVCGSFSALCMTPIPDTQAFFYNPDKRRGAFIDSENKQVDTNCIQAAQQLFTQHNQREIIIATGAAHSIAIIPTFQEWGFVLGEMILSEVVQKIDSQDKVFTRYLNSSEILTPEDTYTLIANPLDLHAAFNAPFVKDKKLAIADLTKQLKKVLPILGILGTVALLYNKKKLPAAITASVISRGERLYSKAVSVYRLFITKLIHDVDWCTLPYLYARSQNRQLVV